MYYVLCFCIMKLEGEKIEQPRGKYGWIFNWRQFDSFGCVGDKESRETVLEAVFLSSSFCISQSNSCPQATAVSSKAPRTHSFCSRPLLVHSAALEPVYMGLSLGWPPGPSLGPDSTLPLIHTSKTKNTKSEDGLSTSHMNITWSAHNSIHSLQSKCIIRKKT